MSERADGPALRRYWFRFDVAMDDSPPLGVLIGCGVTARDQVDAEGLLASRVFGVGAVPVIIQVIKDVDVSDLDPNHVRPNMGDASKRGVWFPLGYDRET